MTRRLAAVLAATSLVAGPAAGETQCRLLDLSFAPARGDAQLPNDYALPQIVAWLEDTDGNFVDTVYITQATGTYGIGNRPGRFDFNSGPRWPYGRRTTTFPVWAHKQPLRWPELRFQDDGDNNLSHGMQQSSVDRHFCRPLKPSEFVDAITCPSTSYTDKGRLESSRQSLYPPRNDLEKSTPDDGSVAELAVLNPFDAVSQPTPAFGVDARYTYAVSSEVPAGDYVLWVEVSKENDMNDSYNATVYPPPRVAFREFGTPYRGQPSVLYRVPVSLANESTVASTLDYVGYGSPDGTDGGIRPPDATIASTPGSGAGRLAIQSADGMPYRVRVVSRREVDFEPPALPAETSLSDTTATSATIELVAPGDDGTIGTVAGYEVRYLVGDVITEATFASARLVTLDAVPVAAGELQTLVIPGLLPETEYSIGIRAYDNCRNSSALVVVPVTTPERLGNEVDACFIATAAYGSAMANDVATLRAFRDAVLAKTALGQLAIEAYYTFGPPVAGLVGESELLRATSRAALDPLIRRVR